MALAKPYDGGRHSFQQSGIRNRRANEDGGRGVLAYRPGRQLYHDHLNHTTRGIKPWYLTKR